MSKFFDDEAEIDYGIVQNHDDVKPHAPAIKDSKNGGISNQAYLNDYRNRMPFHYIEEGTDGYYYWQYGSTLVLEFEITDEVALTDPIVEYVTDVRENGESVLDRTTGVADITLGTMAKEDVGDYYTSTQVDNLSAKFLAYLTTVHALAKSNEQRISALEATVLDLAAEDEALQDSILDLETRHAALITDLEARQSERISDLEARHAALISALEQRDSELAAKDKLLDQKDAQIEALLASLTETVATFRAEFEAYKSATDAEIYDIRYGSYYENSNTITGGSASITTDTVVIGTGGATLTGNEVVYAGGNATSIGDDYVIEVPDYDVEETTYNYTYESGSATVDEDTTVVGSGGAYLTGNETVYGGGGAYYTASTSGSAEEEFDTSGYTVQDATYDAGTASDPVTVVAGSSGAFVTGNETIYAAGGAYGYSDTEPDTGSLSGDTDSSGTTDTDSTDEEVEEIIYTASGVVVEDAEVTTESLGAFLTGNETIYSAGGAGEADEDTTIDEDGTVYTSGGASITDDDDTIIYTSGGAYITGEEVIYVSSGAGVVDASETNYTSEDVIYSSGGADIDEEDDDTLIFGGMGAFLTGDEIIYVAGNAEGTMSGGTDDDKDGDGDDDDPSSEGIAAAMKWYWRWVTTEELIYLGKYYPKTT